MKNSHFVAIDFETATYDRMPCQIGITVVSSGCIVEEKEFLIKPPKNKFDDGCIKVHNITPDRTEGCSEFDILWPEIKSYLHQRVIVAHSIEFDFDVLKRVCEFYNLDPIIPISLVCTKKLFLDKGLEEVSTALEIEMSNHHNALDDARICALIFLEYLKGVNPYKLNYPGKISKRNNGVNFNKIEKNKISLEAKTQDLSTVKNVENIFYDKKVVISGEFDRFPIRDVVALELKSLGAKIVQTISRQTDFFIIGSAFGPSKMKKTEEYQAEGFPIIIVEENQLYKILDSIEK